MEWFKVAFGLAYPSAEYALNKMTKMCVQLSATSYLVKSKTGFADAVNSEAKRLGIHFTVPETLRKRNEHLSQTDTLRYPCMVFFTDDAMSTIKVDYDQSDALE